MEQKKSNQVLVSIKNSPFKVKVYVLGILVVFVYLIICVGIYLSAKHVTGYEVIEGTLAVSNRYTGIALRDEIVIDSGASGYVNYFASEGEKVAFNEIVCCVDETGAIRDYLVKNSDDSNNILSEKDLAELKNQMINYSTEFNKKDFYSTYDFKYSLKGDILKFSNRKLRNSLEEIKAQSNLVIPVSSPSTGVVLYTIDGYERSKVEEVEAAWFDRSDYDQNKKRILENNAIVNPGDALFKLVDNENWSIVIQVEPERYDEILAEEYVKVRFYKNQYESWAKIDSVEGNDDGKYLKLSFTNSMISFVGDRFVDIQLLINAEKGLKIPNTAITQKQFYIIPYDFLIEGGMNSRDGIMVRKTTEDGKPTVVFVETHIYSKKKKYEILGLAKDTDEYNNAKRLDPNIDDDFAYIDGSGLELNDVIVKNDSMDTYSLSQSGTLTGVYNINRGYAEFRIISILSANEEYSIVSSGTTYGLLVHDYIALDAESVDTDDFIYE